MEKNERTLGMLCHLLAFVGFIGIPFGNILGPLVLWLVKKDESEFVNDQGKEALNFQITMTLAALVAMALIIVLIGIPLLIAIVVVDIIFVIIAAIKANEGQPYRYPFALRLIK